MKKNIKKSTTRMSNSNNNGYMDLPEVINMDSLSYFDDENLDRLHNHLQNEREKAARFTEDLTAWEVEICYVQREMRIRNQRRVLHERYLKANPDAYYDSYTAEEYENASSV